MTLMNSRDGNREFMGERKAAGIEQGGDALSENLSPGNVHTTDRPSLRNKRAAADILELLQEVKVDCYLAADGSLLVLCREIEGRGTVASVDELSVDEVGKGLEGSRIELNRAVVGDEGPSWGSSILLPGEKLDLRLGEPLSYRSVGILKIEGGLSFLDNPDGLTPKLKGKFLLLLSGDASGARLPARPPLYRL